MRVIVDVWISVLDQNLQECPGQLSPKLHYQGQILTPESTTSKIQDTPVEGIGFGVYESGAYLLSGEAIAYTKERVGVAYLAMDDLTVKPGQAHCF